MTEFFFFRWFEHDSQNDVGIGFGTKDGKWYCRCTQLIGPMYADYVTVEVERGSVPNTILDEYNNMMAL